MKHISILVKPASALCNLRCKYCFYADVTSLREVRSYGKMKHETAQKMIENIFRDLNDGDELTIAFQGGEPTLAGLPYFQFIVDCVNEQTKAVEVHYAIQTNGTIITERWCEFFKKNNFLVGLSIDGTPTYHDLNRLDPRGRGTFHRVLLTKKLFDQYGIEYNVLCVLTEPLSYHAKEVFDFINQQSFKFVQFIPCLDDLEATERNEYGLTPQGFYRFYKAFLPLWLEALKKGNCVSIKLFDDVINLLAVGRVTACGMLGNCQVQYVIEGDGSVYPCDFYALDEFRLGYIQEMGLREMFMSKVAKNFLCSRPISALPEKCQTCPFARMCRGGCKRMKDAVYVDEKSNFCGYQRFLTDFIPEIDGILQAIAS
ncbi:radical SAM protein [Streptococcus merionis]|uniref:radical SAM/SPASM domain-containing protein n=1 Tax=Streptococcus merionis TaxID=400065 RepID=UPI0026EF8CFA|nr:radical SAM protein [Streptococcus merionis]